MWRKFVLTAVILAVGGFAAASYAQFGGGGGGGQQGGGMSEQQRKRMQRMRELQRKVQRAPKTMDSHKGTVYMVKQGKLLKLNKNLEQQQSIDLGRTFRPQVAAEKNRVFLTTYKNIRVYNTDLEEVKSVETSSVGPEPQSSGGMSIPGAGQ